MFLRVAVDVVEIGERQAKLGEVLKVKVLAVWAMIDEGDLDWKVVVISVDDPKAHLVNNVADVEEHFPVSPEYHFIQRECSMENRTSSRIMQLFSSLQ